LSLTLRRRGLRRGSLRVLPMLAGLGVAAALSAAAPAAAQSVVVAAEPKPTLLTLEGEVLECGKAPATETVLIRWRLRNDTAQFAKIESYTSNHNTIEGINSITANGLIVYGQLLTQQRRVPAADQQTELTLKYHFLDQAGTKASDTLTLAGVLAIGPACQAKGQPLTAVGGPPAPSASASVSPAPPIAFADPNAPLEGLVEVPTDGQAKELTASVSPSASSPAPVAAPADGSSLPVTGPGPYLIGGAVLLLSIGAVVFFAARRRRLNFLAH